MALPHDTSTTLQYGLYEFEKYGYASIPRPRVNGGHYTGARFHNGASYGNKPMVPDVDFEVALGLPDTAPAEARYQFPGNIRPGNNYQNNTGITQYSSVHAIQCIPRETISGELIKRNQYVNKIMPYDPSL